MDGRPDRRNKATLSNFSSVVWMRFGLLSALKRPKTLMKTEAYENGFKSGAS